MDARNNNLIVSFTSAIFPKARLVGAGAAWSMGVDACIALVLFCDPPPRTPLLRHTPPYD
ncbi:MAG: hypothetical protein M3Y76_09355 [Chloroflexota bacterium]|nr:hypothetical protein [Chloroflexota bacterium]